MRRSLQSLITRSPRENQSNLKEGAWSGAKERRSGAPAATVMGPRLRSICGPIGSVPRGLEDQKQLPQLFRVVNTVGLIGSYHVDIRSILARSRFYFGGKNERLGDNFLSNRLCEENH